MDTIIGGGTVAIAGRSFDADVGIEGGRIVPAGGAIRDGDLVGTPEPAP